MASLLDGLEAWAKRVAAVTIIIGGALAAGRWLVRAGRAIRAELRFRRSVADGIARLEATLAEVRADVAAERRMRAVAAQRWRAWHRRDPDGLAELSADGSLEWANDTLLSWFGLPLQEAQGNGWITALADESRDDVPEEWRACVAQRRAFDRDVRYRSGQLVHAHATPIVDDRGELAGWAAIVTDKGRTS